MAADGAGAMLPSSNRGVSEFRQEPEEGIAVGFDWIAFSVDLFAAARETGAEFDGGLATATDITISAETALRFAQYVFGFYLGGCGMVLSDDVRGGRFYAWRIAIQDGISGDFCGVVELGGAHTLRRDGTVTCRLELSGDGCRRCDGAGDGHAKRWLALRAKLESTGGRLTRLDVCADDTQGLYPVRLARQWWDEGEFDNRGQRPKARLYDDLGSGAGKTFYVGSPSSERQLRVYEKGREMGDPSSEWVRYEAQFRASSRKDLPLDMLRDPSAYLLGAYPVLRFLQACALRIDVTKESAKATWKSVRRHLKRQYGNTFNFIALNVPDNEALGRVIRSLTGNKLPPWSSESAAKLWPEIVAAQYPAPEGNYDESEDLLAPF
ncbi:replication initiation factor domain-containing protein [Lysobacter sp. A6]|uniref:Replication initiation factor domain-containing protein n=1 Tax=Noviluteimonas lactosilytica TaxID=2888523 RepID=A0ABS8JI37_9GAMM|nr:replication initiation factor domain-containing protein [Lysobacter lactosilyticus]MCC8363259.1 replication initiation factor domain-containing protein [Lysobacter lactosilyticus]